MKNKIEWESTYTDEAVIQYRVNSQWLNLDGEGAGFLDWNIPEDMVGLVELRALIKTDTFYAEPVLISEQPTLDVSVFCEAFVLLEVEGATQADSFSFFLLGEDGFEELGRTEVPQLNYSDSPLLESDYLYVQPYYGEKTGIRSNTINVANLSPSCVLSFFDVEAEVDRVELILELEGEEYVDKAEFYRVTENGQDLITEINSGFSSVISVSDENPKIGLNKYKVIVFLLNDQKVESNIREVFYVGESNFLVLPTLLSVEEDFLTVFNNDPSRPSISVYNQVGKVVLNKQLVLGVDLIDLADTQGGVYYYIIRNKEGEVLDQGSIIAL